MPTVRLFVVAGLLAVTFRPAAAQSLDPTFTPPAAYAPGAVYSALEQPDGKRIVTGSFLRINGSPVSSRLVRFNADGSLDNAFLQNVGTASSVQRMHLLSTGQVLLVGFGGSATTAGGVARSGGLLRLNADGTADASFDAGTGPTNQQSSVAYLNDAGALPNGKVVAVGPFDHFSGAVANNIVGLNADGTLDPSFNAGTGADGEIATIVALPSGKMLIGGYFSMYNGFTCGGIARLNADGSFDQSFSRNTTTAWIDNITVQPDGKILAAGFLPGPGSQGGMGVLRLNANGTLDNTFSAPASGVVPNSYYGDAMQVQPGGKIVVLSNASGSPSLTRLNADGSLDASYQVTSGPNGVPFSLTPLAGGGTLVMGSFSDLNGTLDRTLLQLTSAGAVDASFQPKIQTSATVFALARQPDGKYIVGGHFSEIGGQTARRLARFNADGTPDQAFAYNTGGLNFPVNELALQPDGRVLVLQGQLVRRFQTNGLPDNSFVVAPFPVSPTRLVLQPDGKVLVGSQSLFSYGGQAVAGVVRLTGSGSFDNTFAPAVTGPNSLVSFHALNVQPDGKVLLAGAFRAATSSGATTSRLMRYTAAGAPDPTFTAPTFTQASGTPSTSMRASTITVQPDGKLLLGGQFGGLNGTSRPNLARLNADGTLDAGFAPPTVTGNIYALAVQANNRVLVGGAISSPGLPTNLLRLNADGTADASFAASAVPNGAVRSLLVQSDGDIVAGGGFTTLSGQSAHALARLNAPNVLNTALTQAVADRTQAWPVPAHTTLHVALDPAARAQTLELLDVLGRPVRRQPLAAASEARVSVAGLPAGQYLLRVHYAQGTVARRISVQ